MKKILTALITAFFLVCFINLTAFAEEKLTITSPQDTLNVGDTVVVSLEIGEALELVADSIRADVTYSKQFEILNINFVDTLNATFETNFSGGIATATLNYTSPTEISGKIIEITIKALSPLDNRNLRVDLLLKHKNEEIFSDFASEEFDIVCTNHVFSDWKVVLQADCLNEGEEERSCDSCDFTETRKIEVIPHNYADMEVLREPTCTEVGYKRGYCIYCQQKLLEQIEPLGHTTPNYQTVVEATCTTEGTEETVCTRCGHTETRSIQPLGHNMSEWTAVSTPSCTDRGLDRQTCSRCDYSQTREKEAKGHNISDWVTLSEPTCEVNGIKQKKCYDCDYAENEELVALGHEFKEAVVTTEPTIGKEGIKTGYCIRCSETTEAPVPCAYTDTNTGIHFDTAHGVYPENAKVKITLAEKNSSLYNDIASSLAHITNQFYGYNIEITSMGFAIAPEGEVTVSFPIPEKYAKNSVFYFINDDGAVKKLSVVTDEALTTATFKFLGNGKYAICKTQYAVDDTFISPATVNSKNVIVIAAIALVLCWCVVALRIIKVKNPALYKRITAKLPKFSQIKYWFKRNIFILKEKIKKPQ